MRVCHVITRMILGGAQENTLLTCEDLIHQHGDEVLLVTGPPLGPEGSLLARAEKHHVPVQIVDSLRREIHLGRDWKSYRRLRQILREFRPEVVHTHSAKAGILGRLAAAALRVPAIVHTVHGAPFYPEQGWSEGIISRWSEWYVARRTQAFISVAEAMTDLMVRCRIAARNRFTTIYSGMEVEPFLQADSHRGPTRAELGYQDHHIVVGKIARLFPLKGYEYLLKAIPAVVRRNRNVRFLVIGDGLLQDHLRRLCRAGGLEEYIRFVGLVPPERIPAMISAMDLLVHASLREGLARALPQALLVGRPVVSYDIDGACEVVKTGQTGVLVPPRHISDLAGAILFLAEDEQLRKQYGHAGQERCRELFRHDRMTKQIREVYQNVLNPGSPV